MVEADPVMRAARNGFGVLIVALLLAWALRVVVFDTGDPVLFVLWMLGALVYWVSQYYYKRQEATDDGGNGSVGDGDATAADDQ